MVRRARSADVDSAWRPSVGRLVPDSGQVRTRIFGGLPTNQTPRRCRSSAHRHAHNDDEAGRSTGQHPPPTGHRSGGTPSRNSLLLTNGNGSPLPVFVGRRLLPSVRRSARRSHRAGLIEEPGASALRAAGAGRTLTQTPKMATPEAGARSMGHRARTHRFPRPSRIAGGSASVRGERQSRGREHLWLKKMRNVLPGAPREDSQRTAPPPNSRRSSFPRKTSPDSHHLRSSQPCIGLLTAL